jgi:hypothetical protein
VKGRVEGREKHLYSVYQKMRRKRSPLASIVDVFGFRIVVDSVDTCYRALGLVHGLYRPMPGRFKDYIAIPAHQRLPVAAHHAVRPERHADRSADPHRRHASHRRVRHRGALAVQDRRGSGQDYRDRASEWLQH